MVGSKGKAMKHLDPEFTKETSKQAMLDNSRSVCDPEYAEDLLRPFGQTLESLGIKPIPSKLMNRLNYALEDADRQSVPIYELSQKLAYELTGERVTSGMYGRGSYAQDVTEKAVALLK